jgi:hypothetical protein
MRTVALARRWGESICSACSDGGRLGYALFSIQALAGEPDQQQADAVANGRRAGIAARLYRSIWKPPSNHVR